MNGWYYLKNEDDEGEGEFTPVEITDELIEVAQQAAIWYYTNYKDTNNNAGNAKSTFNVRTQGLALKYLDYNTYGSSGSITQNNWQSLEEKDNIQQGSITKNVGRMLQNQATLLCWYLIDAAEEYTKNGYISDDLSTTGVPLKIEPNTTIVTKQTVQNEECYVVGPIKIKEQTKVRNYTLNSEIKVKLNGEDEQVEASITNSRGEKVTGKEVKDYIGKNDLYISIPKSSVSEEITKIEFEFEGTYNINEKKLWICSTAKEQPVVEVTPKTENFSISVSGNVPKEGEKSLDLALRKAIIKVTDKNGNEKLIVNEQSKDAKRQITCDTSTIAGNSTTATYKHRKDPVVVQIGDKVTYEITIYNEGEVNGYAKTIVDQLPASLKVEPKTGTYTSPDKSVKYSYEYDEKTNQITFTNETKNDLVAYAGQNELSHESIQIECVVTGERPKDTKKYLTNIAYITKEHDSHKNQDVDVDIDSHTNQSPDESNLEPTGDKYNGYHGGDGAPDVYDDTNNDLYFNGEEDDDDFEVLVVRPKEFDLALQKYITEIYSNGEKTKGREAPKINTEYLANGTANTAEYELDKSKIKVKHGDYVTYTFTVYNEGDVAGYVDKITDNVPGGLQFVYVDESMHIESENRTVIAYDSEGNMESVTVDQELYDYIKKYNSYWSVDKENGADKKVSYNGKDNISITCDVAKYLQGIYPDKYNETTDTNKLLAAYDSSKDPNFDGSGLDSVSVTVVLRVEEPDGSGKTIRNEAAITEAEDEQHVKQDVEDLTDRDSHIDEWPGKDDKNNYEDDEDYDNIYLGGVDLALKKFIAALSLDEEINDGEYLTPNGNVGSETNPYDRATRVDTTELKENPDCHDATYEMKKDSITIPKESYILYKIRVYNEGEMDVYAGEVTDYLPENLEFVECDINTQYGWEYNETEHSVTTSYLSKEKSDDNIIKAFDKEKDKGAGEGLSYKELEIVCKVKPDAPTKTRFINTAEVTKYQDEDGNELDSDVDSEPKNVEEKNKEKNYQDDDDYEVVEVRDSSIDLALTKFIIAVSEDEEMQDGEYLTKDTTSNNAGSETNPYTRQTKVDTTKLRDNIACHDATYEQVKTPLEVPKNAYVLYNIRVYNEGETDVYAREVADYLPDYLEFVDGEYNREYGWQLDEDERTVRTSYLSSENGEDKLLKAFNKSEDDGNGSGLDYRDLPILCKLIPTTPGGTKLVNTAEITKYEDKDGTDITEDVDSQPDNVQEKNKENREQDDDDYEVVIVKEDDVDLALTKFIAAISNDINITDGEYLTENGNIGSKENPYTRATKVNTQELRDNEECHDAEYYTVKTPLTVPAQSYVLYDIRVYNEGTVDVYAGEVTDFLPDYLDFIDCEFNQKYGWTVESDGKTIKTKYLSHENGEDKLLSAFDKENDDGEGSGLDYRDLQVLCRINDKAPSKTQIINVAEITKYEDENGNDLPKDKDSTPDNSKNNKHEDDDDYEVVEVKTFDLSLLKYVSTVYVTEDGKTIETKTGNTGNDATDIIPKVDINRKKLNKTVVKFGYTIKITNEGEVAGYAKEITDYVPEGLKFYEEDNQGWTDEGNNVISTRLLENTLLEPGQSAEITVILRWVNASDNLGMKTNTAEISEDYNDEGIPDKDSTPDNKKPDEDDIDDASVILAISTGIFISIIKYVGIAVVIIGIIGVGIFAIKKLVL